MSASEWNHEGIEQFLDWIVENTTSDNPVLATGTAFVQSLGWLTMTTLGPAYAGWLLKIGVPIFPLSSGLVTSSIDIYPSLDAVNGQAWEFDSRWTDASGNVWVGDSQLNIEEGGMLQVMAATGGWVDTGFKPGIPPAGQWSTIQTVFKFGNGTSSIVSASAWGQTWVAPSTVPEVSKQAISWAPNQFVKQLQIDENALGQAYSLSFRNINALAVGSL